MKEIEVEIEVMAVRLGIKAGTEITRGLEGMMTGRRSVTIETIVNETENANGKEIEIVMTNGIRTKNMVHHGDNVVLRLLHLEHQDHAICAHGLAQLEKALLWIKQNRIWHHPGFLLLRLIQ
jgi:hypothetical protein